MNRQTIISQIREVEERIQNLSERLYNPDINNSEMKEITKRKKKLIKTKNKLSKKLDMR
tara:strand:+ start:1076 stop:1252 length:177 start_codon:yes stop_codon:yes gene_type:complete